MDNVESILSSIPIFCHCSRQEITRLRGQGRIIHLARGQKLDVRALATLNVVIRGMFEIEALGQNDIMYLAPGSFFGEIPFTAYKHRGSVKALVDSEVCVFEIDEVFRFFLTSFKAMRGYLKTLDRMGFGLSDAGRRYIGTTSRILCAYGRKEGLGTSLFASCLGSACAIRGRTIVLDMSYRGTSVFDYFERRITGAISQKSNIGAPAAEIISECVADVDERLSLMNIAFGSKVRVNPDILSPILFVLSREYEYIIVDLSDEDPELRDRVFSLADSVCAMLQRARDREDLYGMFDASLTEGQRVLYVINRNAGREQGQVDGAVFFDVLGIKKGESAHAAIRDFASSKGAVELLGILAGPARALVCQSVTYEAAAFAGVLNALSHAGQEFSSIYSSSYSQVVSLLFLASRDQDEFLGILSRFLPEEKLGSFLDITFPESHVAGSGRIRKFMKEILGDKRIEFFRSVPIALLAEGTGTAPRLFSTGPSRDIAAASFALHPVVQSVEIAGGEFHSGMPYRKVRPEDLFRCDIGEIVYVTVRSRQPFEFTSKRVIKFYRNYLEMLYLWKGEERLNVTADKNIQIDLTERTYSPEKIIKLSEEMTNKLLIAKRI
ncbi:MAG: hypothetical protein EPN93_03315 [Spirochaetes bacterium]|nr:MAG: hypothetical protein EPN93_03315 [Spirochaetota bacterium]